MDEPKEIHSDNQAIQSVDVVHSSDETKSDSCHTGSSVKKFQLTEVLRDKLKDFPDVLEYIAMLQKYLEKQRRKIKKLKSKRKVSR